MCGIAGFVGFGNIRTEDAQAIAMRMGLAIAHRGPDDSGVWCDANAEVALVHRRLSIIDLTSAGHQPMLSPSGRFVVIYNGEIYNHAELRAQLPQHQAWRGHSDTETLLAAFETWGIEETLKRAIGMFAIAVWDRQRRVLTLARDRAGEKPLYYGFHGGVVLFGSELKALKTHPAFQGEVDRNALALQMFHNYIPAPHSIYLGIRKLPPGTFLQIDGDAVRQQGRELPEPLPYWRWPRPSSQHEALSPERDEEAIARLDETLRRAVRRQMMSDVPLGAFLSGGIDSSTVVAMMQAQSTRPVQTFSIGFHEAEYDEARHAKAVAGHLGTDHTELYVRPEDALAVIPALPQFYDEPFSDSSQIPTLLLARLARKRVTVSLSGDAADELFGGYSRYQRITRAWSVINRMPASARRVSAAMIRSLPVPVWNGLTLPARAFLPLRGRNIGHKAHKFAGLIDQDDRMRFYRHFDSHWQLPEQVVVGASRLQPHAPSEGRLEFHEEMMLADALAYLPDDILAKVDRAAMATSLETRVPFLDPDVIELAAGLPLNMKIRHGQGKWVLRQVLHKYVPRELVERPKMGFGVPIDSWLRGPLRDWGEALLDESRLRREGYFHPAPIRQAWREHRSGVRNWQYQLWDVLMFQLWLEHQRGSGS
jgi:asparagine synthase (glutamine-hydrolysing)